MNYDFDQVIERRGSDSIKWNRVDPDVLPMWVADMDFLSPQPVINALRERAAQGFFGYPDSVEPPPNELPELRAAIVDWIADRHNWRIQPEWLVFVPGVVTGFNMAAKSLAASEAVFIQTPVYRPILTVARGAGIVRQNMDLTRASDGSYTVDWDLFDASFTAETRMFLLCNPHNPVGKVFSTAELARMADTCVSKDVIILSDEIHADLVYTESRHTPIASLAPEICDRTITLMAPSKTFNLAGLQCSYAIIANSDLRKWYLKARGELVPWINLFGVVGALAAYREGREWLDQLLPYLQANRDFLMEYVHEHLPGVKMGCPQGTYLAWLDCRESGIPGIACQFFKEKARVGFSDGADFGSSGDGFVRMNFGCPRPLLTEALERMRLALESLG